MLALVTGLLALGLYYYGLQRTPALLASLGELAFPVTAALVGIYVFDSSLRWTQWLGVAITVGVISLLPVRRRELVDVPRRPRPGSRLPDAEQPAERDPVPVVVALELRLVEREVVAGAGLDGMPGSRNGSFLTFSWSPPS